MPAICLFEGRFSVRRVEVLFGVVPEGRAVRRCDVVEVLDRLRRKDGILCEADEERISRRDMGTFI